MFISLYFENETFQCIVNEILKKYEYIDINYLNLVEIGFKLSFDSSKMSTYFSYLDCNMNIIKEYKQLLWEEIDDEIIINQSEDYGDLYLTILNIKTELEVFKRLKFLSLGDN